MSARTPQQLIGAKILEKIRAQSNANTTVLVDNASGAAYTTFQDNIADEIATDTNITSRKTQTVPTSFGTNDTVLVIGQAEPFLTRSQIKQRLRTAADVRFIVAFGAHFEDREFENFVVVSEERVQALTGADTYDYPVKVFRREKVFV